MGRTSRGPLAYTGVRSSNPPQQIINRRRAPTAQDYLNFNIGDLWLYMDMDTPEDSELYQLVSNAENVAVWNRLSDTNQVWPDHAVVLGSGTDTINSVAPTTAGFVLTSNGPSADPTWQAAAGGIENLDGDTGTATGTTIDIAGGTGITTVASGSTVTINLDSPVSVLNGGTGDTSLTAYAPICGGTTAVSPVQAATAGLSNVGYVLTSTGASSLPTWQPVPSGNGSEVFIATLTANNDTELVFDATMIDGTYSMYKFRFNDLFLDNTGASALNFTVSTDDGATYIGASDYKAGTYSGLYSAGLTNVSSTLVNGIASTATYNRVNGYLEFYNTQSSDYASWIGETIGDDGVARFGLYQGTVTIPSAINNIKFESTGGVLTSGTITLYGISTTGGGGGSGGVDTLTGDTGGAISPSGGDINILGGTGISTAGSGSSITVNLDIPVVVASGGTGLNVLSTYALLAGGTTGTGNVQQVSGLGTSGQVLTSAGAGALPTWQTPSASGISTLDGDTGSATGSTVDIVGGIGITTSATGSAVTIDLDSPVAVSNGGTGITSATAYAPICAGTTGTGAFQVASSGISNVGYVLTSTGASSVPTWQPAAGGGGGGGLLNIQVFDTPGAATYTPTSGMETCIIEVIGGGGGGGSVVTASTLTSAGAGGGSGGYCKLFSDAATIGASQNLFVGSGGAGGVIALNANGSDGTDSTFGTVVICTAEGGKGGGGSQNGVAAEGGDGGSSTGADVNASGQNGFVGTNCHTSGSSQQFMSGAGGSTIYGSGGKSLGYTPGFSNGENGSGYGSGGSGSFYQSGVFPGTLVGGDGADGIVVVYEYGGGASGIVTLTGDTGGAVSETLDNVNIVGEADVIEVAGNPGTSTLTVNFVGSFEGDTGSATFATGVGEINILGGTGITTSATGDTVTIDLDSPVVVSNGGSGLTSTTPYAVVTGGTTGTGALQQVSGVGTTGQVLTSAGAGALPTWQTPPGGGGGLINVQVFDTPGAATYTPTAGMQTCIVKCVGGGGGSGNCNGGASRAATGGGGSGAYVEAFFDAATIGASQSLVIGAGGAGGASGGANNGSNGSDTTFGSLITAGGGSGSIGSTSTEEGGAGGVATGGDINIDGQKGLSPVVATAGMVAGAGGSNPLGQGGVTQRGGVGGVGFVGTGYGSGGGGSQVASGTIGVDAADGRDGVIIVYEY